MTTLLIGIDDTDNATSRGTGWLARMLLEECTRRGFRAVGVTRHQLLVDPRIPYTTHNSGACVVVEPLDAQDGAAFAFGFVAERAAEGSDPGVCVARLDVVPGEILEFGRRAATEVVEMSEALRLARDAGVDLRPLGGTGLGVIGALASVGLHAGGNDGRFLQLPGLRDLPARVGREDLTRLGITLDHRGGRPAAPDDAYETLGWVRPNLREGKPVLPVEWNEEHNAWTPVERKRTHPLA